MDKTLQHDSLPLRVNVNIYVHDAQSGELLDAISRHNLVVLAGRNLVRDLLYIAATNPLSHCAVGTGSTAATANDTALGAEVFRSAITQFIPLSGQLQVKHYLSSTQANGNTLTEAGLFNASSGGTMFARVTYAGIAKTSAISITYVWTTMISAS